ncbi:uncharacterized protein BYT42DRAFT_559494 [Radiomyces spectabilis]|uniref:uncharacterized protein n=1 Tax=Radiomyces spectabilis TaxID=64574 RepID=UPI00221FB9E7|nr:uncharacterized protein BYT42DRAFT_559494 [Radiomyces spectabilis]KAI8388260.1 hypothetical protein BYT42DRAFT_559494 [Radiomyces spectabilis]
MTPFTVLPATCELCGNWLPQHQSSCPRNGVHPSQWTASRFNDDPVTETMRYPSSLHDVHDDDSCHTYYSDDFSFLTPDSESENHRISLSAPYLS